MSQRESFIKNYLFKTDSVKKFQILNAENRQMMVIYIVFCFNEILIEIVKGAETSR